MMGKLPILRKPRKVWHRQKQHTAASATRACSLDLEQPGSHPGLMKPCALPAQGRFFLGLVVIADAKLPIPSRTRPISAPTPMVLRLKTWESRSPPNLERNDFSLVTMQTRHRRQACKSKAQSVAGWSSHPSGRRRRAFADGQTQKTGLPGRPEVAKCRGVEQPGSSSGS
jgi:hypothetical protein